MTHLASLPLGGRPLDADPRSLERLLTHPPSPEVLAYRHQILAELVESPEARKDLIEERNKLDNLIYQVEKSLAEHGAKLPPAEKTNLDAALADARAAKDSDDIGRVKGSFDKLTAASHKLSEVLYQQAQAGGGDAGGPTPPPAGGGGGQDDVIDAEYEDA